MNDVTSVFRARRRAEDFALLVDGALPEDRAGDQALVDLAGVATLLREHEQVAPRDEFARDLRARLLLDAATSLSPETARLQLPARTRGARERRLVAAASAAVLIGGTATMAAAAQSALPGEALYPIKRGIERAEAGLTLSPAGKGRELLAQAQDRLVEVEGLLSSDAVQSPSKVAGTLDTFSSQAADGAGLLFESFQETRDPDAITTVRVFTAEGMATLDALTGTVPVDAQDELAAAAVVLRDLDREAERLCTGCAADLPSLDLPGSLIAHSEADRALQQTAEAPMLSNSHPVVVPKGTLSEPAPGPGGGPLPTPAPAAPADPGNGNAQPAPGTPPILPTPDTGSPGSLPDLLPQPGGKTGSGKSGGGTGAGSSGGSGGKVTAPVEDVADDVTDGVSDVVETILPDVEVEVPPPGGILP